MYKARLLIPLAFALVSAVGCGDDDSNESSARAETISKQQYIARSGAICESTGQKAGVQFERIVGSEGAPPPGQERRYLVKAQRFLSEAAIPIIRENIERRRELPAPAGDAGEIEAIFAAGEKALVGFLDVASDPAKTRALFEGKLADPAKLFDALAESTASTSAAATSDQ